MAGYSEQFLLSLGKSDSKSIGVKLAKLCTEANLPTLYIADTFAVDRRTVHRWFRGSKFTSYHKIKITQVIQMIERGLELGILPARSQKEAKEYLKRMPM